MNKKEYFEGHVGESNGNRALLSLLKRSDAIRMRREQWETGLLFKKKLAGDEAPQFLRVKNRLQNEFIRKEKNNEVYGHQKSNYEEEHYFYKMSAFLRELVQRELLHWNSTEPNGIFYGFDDFAFFRKGKLIGYVINHEEMVYTCDAATN